MDEKEVNNLIEKRILEAKLDISDRKFNYLVILAGGLLAIFGLFFPIWQANTSTEKVDKAIEEMRTELKSQSERNDSFISKYSEDAKSQLKEMAKIQTEYNVTSSEKIDKEILSFENRFKEMAGKQLRKPIMICNYKSNTLENCIIQFDKKTHQATLVLKNIGDATAKNIRIKLYINTDKNVHISGDDYNRDSDEQNYNIVSNLYVGDFNTIDPKDSQTFNFSISTEVRESLLIPALLKIYYEQPDPVRYYFTIKYDFK
jgi:hypothetical protein